MILSTDVLNELATYAEWFVVATDRFPSDFAEIADYLEEERMRGAFPNAAAVRALGFLTHSHNGEQIFGVLKEYYRELAEIGEVRPACQSH